MDKPTDSKPVTGGSTPPTPADWVVRHSVFYLYGVDWVYGIERESSENLKLRMLLHGN